MKYYIIAGEASGDLHGSNLVKGLVEKDPSAKIRAWGGELMAKAGAEVVKDYRENSIMGFVEVLQNLGKILGNLKECKRDIESFSPDVVVLIDYPGFNMKIAKFAKSRGYKVFYYIAPKVWAWKEHRVHDIKRYVDKLFIIFPFEVDYFRRWEIDAIYRGNPLLDSVCNFANASESKALFQERIETKRVVLCRTAGSKSAEEMPIIGALAGSRKMETGFLLPRIVDTALKMPGYRFILAAAPSMSADYIRRTVEAELAKCGSRECNLEVVSGETYAVLQQSVAAIISSGTASLETALLKIPQVVCYGGNPITYWIARSVVKLKYISLANLILDKLIFRELLQGGCTGVTISQELERLIGDADYRSAMLADYDKVHEILGGGGASGRIAEEIVRLLSKNK